MSSVQLAEACLGLRRKLAVVTHCCPVSLAGHLQFTPCAGGAVIHCAAGLQPESAARVHLAEKPALSHGGEGCQADRIPAKEKVSCRHIHMALSTGP